MALFLDEGDVPGPSIVLCRLYSVVAGGLAIVVINHRPAQEKGSLLGYEYLSYNIYYFKHLHFGVLVAGLIEIMETGWTSLISFRVCVALFAIGQLFLVQTLQNIWMSKSGLI